MPIKMLKDLSEKHLNKYIQPKGSPVQGELSAVLTEGLQALFILLDTLCNGEKYEKTTYCPYAFMG